MGTFTIAVGDGTMSVDTGTLKADMPAGSSKAIYVTKSIATPTGIADHVYCSFLYRRDVGPTSGSDRIAIMQWIVSTPSEGSEVMEVKEEPTDGMMYWERLLSVEPEAGYPADLETLPLLSKPGAWTHIEVQMNFGSGDFWLKLDGTTLKDLTAQVPPQNDIRKVEIRVGLMPIFTPTIGAWTTHFDDITCTVD
jgi:hypothetical protein